MYFNEPHLKSVILQGLAEKRDPRAIVSELVARHGYALHVAWRVYAACVALDGNGGRMQSQLPGHAVACPMPVATRIGAFTLDGRAMRVTFANLYPSIYLIEGFVSDDECDGLIALARGSSRPSQLVLAEGGAPVPGAYGRQNTTTEVAEFEGSPGVTLLRRVSRLVAWPASLCEGLEVQHYREGQGFDLHVDYLEPHMLQTNPRAIESGNCVGNMIIYLNEPAAGGSTYFANLGLEFAPRRGAALFFNYPTMAADSMTLHAGMPVIEGEKFIATTVFRQRPWRRAFDFGDAPAKEPLAA